VPANERAERALELAGLQRRAHAIAGAISHGEQRQLEIAMTLATEPQVLLLDEPLAGMGTAEAERMVALLLRLKQTTPSCWSSTTWTPCSRWPIT
jgi:branched-chain amino acid transport system ATP-binding protein